MKNKTMEEIYTKEEKILRAFIQRRKFEKLKRTSEFRIWKRRQYDTVQRRKCAYCRKPIHYKKLHIDHVFPLFEGGKNSLDNFVLSCPRCNMKKWITTPGKPLWIQNREIELENKKRLTQARQQQRLLAEELLDEHTASLLSWI